MAAVAQATLAGEGWGLRKVELAMAAVGVRMVVALEVKVGGWETGEALTAEAKEGEHMAAMMDDVEAMEESVVEVEVVAATEVVVEG